MYCRILMSTVRFEFRLLLYGVVNKKNRKMTSFDCSDKYKIVCNVVKITLVR